eukprot:12899472-Prorocentrum_lima.AAC.1
MPAQFFTEGHSGYRYDKIFAPGVGLRAPQSTTGPGGLALGFPSSFFFLELPPLSTQLVSTS